MRNCVLLAFMLSACNNDPILLGSEVVVPGMDAGSPNGIDADTSGRGFTSTTLAGEDQPTAIVTGDFNGDGHLDLVVSNNLSGSLSVLIGDGKGGFSPAQERKGAFGLLAAADLDGDHHVDLVVGNANGGPSDCDIAWPCTDHTIAVLLGNGDGSFRDGATYGDRSVSLGPGGLVLGDLNGDGKLDIVYSRAYWFNDTGYSAHDHTIGIQLGNGDGTFRAEQQLDAGAISPNGVVIADFDGDHKPDVVVGTERADFVEDGPKQGSIELLRGNGDGTLQAPVPLAFDTGPCRTLTSLDVNGDGKLDLATADCTGGGAHRAQILVGNGDGTFAAPSAVDLAEYVTFYIGSADFDGDGRADLVIPYFSNEIPSLGHDVVSMVFEPTSQPHQSYFATGMTPRTLAIGDFNEDHRPDLATVDQSSNDITVLLNALP